MNFDENLADFGCGLEEDGSMSKNAAAFLKAYARTSTVFNKVAELKDTEKQELVKSYLDFCYEVQDGTAQKVKNSVDFTLGEGFEGITSKSLPDIKADSASHLLLVEFFTHCCINCIHSIEDVREVHEEIQGLFPVSSVKQNNGFQGMKVLSIHSPKFPREKDLESIKSFCKRMKMEHSEVVNDPQCILWNEFGVTCWPTLLILGPNPEGTGPNLLFNLMGEGHKEDLLLIVKTAMEYFQTSSLKMYSQVVSSESRDTLDTSTGSDLWSDAFLKFPGKVAMFQDRLVVADSGNNRLVVLLSSGHVEKIVGGTQKGNKDGNFNEARFYNPQGIAFANASVFYVADTGNHSIRKVDLQLNQVTTLVSAGSKTEVNGEVEVLKSPWDLAFYDSDSLIIAAAGNHRLFGYFFNNTNLFGAERKADTLEVIAGSGREENRNNSYILKASFAQPSGIAVVTDQRDDKLIYIADSESSSIRCITPKAQVVGVVGGSRDPTDLFAFGDTDGKNVNVKLQHPMGVCAGRNPTEVFVADTYNHKIKRVNVESKECETFISCDLNEPSGICKDTSRNFLYVADTNNHAIKIVDIDNANSHKMTITPPDNINLAKGTNPLETFDKEFEITGCASTIKLNFSLSPLPDAYEGGHWKLLLPNPDISTNPPSGNIEKHENTNEGIFSFVVSFNSSVEKTVSIFVVADVLFCSANSCLKRTKKLKIVCISDSVGETKEKSILWKDLTWE